MSKEIIKFVSHLEIMSEIKRCALHKVNPKQSNAEHSYNVIMYCLFLFKEIEMTIWNEKQVDLSLDKTLILASIHDFEETITTDFPLPLKEQLGSEVMNRVDEYGRKMSKEIFQQFNNPVIDLFFSGNYKEALPEYNIVKLADYIDLMVWTNFKIKTGFSNLIPVNAKCVELLKRNPYFSYSSKTEILISQYEWTSSKEVLV